MVQASPPGETRRKGAVLVIDDDHICREAVSMMLGLAGYLPLPASNGCEAVGLLNASLGEVVAVLLDLHLPGENATELYDALARIHPELPLFLVSGEPEVSAMRRLGRPGTAGFLYKPSGIPAWIEKLEVVLEDGRAVESNDAPEVSPHGEH
jgi:DNA-binding NtrC family response regulator